MIWLFDIDGTLIHSGGAGSHAMAVALTQAFQIPANIEGVAFAGRTDRHITERLLRAHNIEVTTANLHRLHGAYLQALPEALETKKPRILAGAIQWLDRIESQLSRFGLGLITGNMRASARLKLEYVGMWPRFRYGGYGDEHLSRNHVAADAIQAARSHLGPTVRSERIWVVGDTPHDIECARSQGANVIAVATGQYDTTDLAQFRPDFLLEDLSNTDVLDQLLSS